ncbi:MAG: hypothetical protein IID33_04860, partial [Planctomycetes bacterium]|nr:hypothetical protein [Planctomycetota bacterium]
SIVLKHLMQMGALCHINQSLNADVVSRIVQDYGFNLAKIQTQEQQLIETHKVEEEDEKLLKPIIAKIERQIKEVEPEIQRLINDCIAGLQRAARRYSRADGSGCAVY